MSKLDELGLSDYFFYPQISWNAKSAAIEAIAESMNIGIGRSCTGSDGYNLFYE